MRLVAVIVLVLAAVAHLYWFSWRPYRTHYPTPPQWSRVDSLLGVVHYVVESVAYALTGSHVH